MAKKIRYRLYHAPEGGTMAFCGEHESRIGAAMTAQRHQPAGLSADLWETARAAGHCGGLRAPDLEGAEEEEPLVWCGEYCVVRVIYSTENQQ